MKGERWFALGVNPEPWAVGPLDVLRRGGKLVPSMGRNQQLDAYKQAVADEFTTRYGVIEEALAQPGYLLDLYFWRHRARWSTAAQRAARRNDADATNMQKATEDALQGICIDNDRNVIRASSTIIEQGPDVEPGVIIYLRWGVEDDDRSFVKIPQEATMELARIQTAPAAPDSNVWPPR